jgi:hypothetical protein
MAWRRRRKQRRRRIINGVKIGWRRRKRKKIMAKETKKANESCISKENGENENENNGHRVMKKMAASI